MLKIALIDDEKIVLRGIAALMKKEPGFELVGPNGNFSMFSCFSKLVLTFDMLAGRLEIFPLLLLFVRDTWKKF